MMLLLALIIGRGSPKLLLSIIAGLAILITSVLSVVGNLSSISVSAILFTIVFREPGTIVLPKNGNSLKDETCHRGEDIPLDNNSARKYHEFVKFDIAKPQFSCMFSFPLLTTRLFQEVVASRSFPLSVIGVIHAKHVVEQFHCMDEHNVGTYSYSMCVSDARIVDIGAECDVVLEIFSSSRMLMNSTTMTFTSTDRKKAKATKKNRKQLTDEEKLQKTMLSPVKKMHTFKELIKGGHSLKYASISGDTNPIHHPTYCRLMGMNQCIMHGLWSLARSVAAITEEYDLTKTAALRISAAWKLPLPVPCKVGFQFGELVNVEKTEHFEFEDEKFTRHVEFLVTKDSKGEKLPHLRGVVSF